MNPAASGRGIIRKSHIELTNISHAAERRGIVLDPRWKTDKIEHPLIEHTILAAIWLSEISFLQMWSHSTALRGTSGRSADFLLHQAPVGLDP